jgi:hypothetical protein
MAAPAAYTRIIAGLILVSIAIVASAAVVVWQRIASPELFPED